MRKLRLSICKRLHKCLDSDGEWDRTWDESYEYIIYDEEGLEVAGRDGYDTEEKARIADDGKVVEVSRAFEMLQLEWNGKPIEI